MEAVSFRYRSHDKARVSGFRRIEFIITVSLSFIFLKMNKGLTLKKILLIGLLALVVSLIPVGIYWCEFKGRLFSTKPGDWGVFGDFVGGISGTVLSFFAVLFSLTSIYFTGKIAERVQEGEFKFNEEQANTQLKTLHQQNKPYPFIHLSKYKNLTAVTIQNMGLGPLIITRWEVLHRTRSFKSFRHLFHTTFNKQSEDIELRWNSAPQHILAPNSQKRLLKISPGTNTKEAFQLYHSELRNILKDCEISMNYEDVFGNKFKLTKKLDFYR